MKTFELRVAEKRYEANDSVSIVFAVPEELWLQLDYKPGQFITVQFEKDGKPIRRAYSLSSCPYEDDHLQITVKKIEGGLVSSHIHNQVQVGDTIKVLPAAGKFCAEVFESNYKTYYLFGAGSGITPLFSILRSVLAKESKSHVYLFFGNRDENSIIFRELLTEIDAQYGDRFKVVHTLSRPNRDKWSAILNWDGVDWDVRKGRIDEEAIRWFFKEHPPVAQDAQYFICGPGKMIESVEQALLRIGVPDKRIHTERFATNAIKTAVDDEGVVDNSKLSADIHNKSFSCTVPKGYTLLRALMEEGAEVPYSCESGVCGTCKAKLIKGKVHMESFAALTKSEVEAGQILTCQAKPKSADVEIKVS